MRRRCFTAGNGGHVRAVKTIRMQGELDLVGRACAKQREDGSNYSCLLIQLVRHPLSTLRSERQSSRLPQARGVKHPGIVAPGGRQAWMDSRAGNLSGFCEPILKDVKYAMSLKRRKERALRNGKLALASAIPDVLILKYDELLRHPFDVVRMRRVAQRLPPPPSVLCQPTRPTTRSWPSVTLPRRAARSSR